jgi:hypothetical protein
MDIKKLFKLRQKTYDLSAAENRFCAKNRLVNNRFAINSFRLDWIILFVERKFKFQPMDQNLNLVSYLFG